MKIFHTKEGIERVYVQKNDLMHLNRLNQETPAFMIQRYFNIIMSRNNEEKMEFVEFKEPEEVEFFRKADWIIDYNEYMALSNEVLTQKIRSLTEHMRIIADKFNRMSLDDKKENMYFREVYRVKEYIRNSCILIEQLKSGKITMPLPNSVVFSTEQTNDIHIKVKRSI